MSHNDDAAACANRSEHDRNGLAARLTSVRARMDAACRAALKPPGSVTLVAVSKTHDADAVRAVARLGQCHFGENRVQEAGTKFDAAGALRAGLMLHLIGGLQTNKAAAAVALADVIESLDRDSLADAIARAADRAGRLPQLLVQVNTGGESQKSGVGLRDADAFIQRCQTRFGANVTGLMCIPPAGADPAPHFARLAAMADAHGLAVRSMGMSGDFEAAILAGATHVRVGSAIFGARPKAG